MWVLLVSLLALSLVSTVLLTICSVFCQAFEDLSLQWSLTAACRAFVVSSFLICAVYKYLYYHYSYKFLFPLSVFLSGCGYQISKTFTMSFSGLLSNVMKRLNYFWTEILLSWYFETLNGQWSALWIASQSDLFYIWQHCKSSGKSAMFLGLKMLY